jgi:hypothetical protein
VLDVPVTEVALQGAGVVPAISELVSASVSEHVRVRLEDKPCASPGAIDHAGEAGGSERRPALRGEHERRLGVLFALKPP